MRPAAWLIPLILVAPRGAASQDPAPGDTRSLTIPGTDVSFSFAFVPGGTFTLGSPGTEVGRDDDEGPTRAVRISPFWMGVHEVSHDEFALFRHRRLDDDVGPAADVPFDADAVSRPSPPYDDPTHGMGQDGHPAVGMTRWAALHYARWLSLKTGRLFRLPTEAEWEYACESGRGTASEAGSPDELDAVAWYEDNSGGVYHPGGTKAPDALGLHDMQGNVAEWVMDGYAADAYAGIPEPEPARDPVAGNPARGRGVVRGGAFDDPAHRLRCAERFPETPAWKRRDPQMPKSRWWNTDAPHVGFRLASPVGSHTMDEIRAYWAEILGDGGSAPGTELQETTWTGEIS
jgi:formylglycine-generating enzyme required for sulfatase activity